MPKIELATYIKAPQEVVFDWSRSIDLHIESTAQTHEKAVAGKTSGLISLGESVTWRAKHFGVYQNLTSKIIQFDRPNSFTDEMQKDAFKSFTHQHLFSEKEGITEMKDLFEYQSPWGILGKLANKLFLNRYLTNLLEKRNSVIKKIAESGQIP